MNGSAELPLDQPADADAGDRRPGITAFAFGDPEAVLDRRELLGYLECWSNGRWYEPPVPMKGLARARFASPHHASAMKYKTNQLLRHFQPTRWLGRKTFGEFALNFIAMGNGYLEARQNAFGRLMTLKHQPALYTRVGLIEGDYWWAPSVREATKFDAGTIFHLAEPDLTQEIYGVPEWIGALQSALLNEGATLFRRRYFLNGSHMGYVFYVNDPGITNEDADKVRQAMKDAKGPGNFRNLFLHSPAGKEKGVQILPIGEAAAKDEFLGIKDTTRDDVLAAHRVPPVVLGIVPKNAGGFGNIFDASNAFHQAEIEPLQLRMLEVNDWAGVEAVVFKVFVPMAAAQKAP